MSVSLLPTKFYIPRTRRNVVSRLRLMKLLDEGLAGPLTLISAPAGFGKTTFLGEWHGCESAKKFKIAWLSLDQDDNEPSRFLAYIAASFHRLQMGLGEAILAALESPQQLPFNVLLTSLINDLCNLGTSSVLVLDDYHLIHSQVVHEAVIFLLNHLPDQLHLVISTRSDPPLPLPRLRASNQLMEIRADQLRFTSEEATAFLNQVMNLSLSPANITTLENRTEGWIAGLQMAALSMQGREDIPKFIESFSGSHHYILDYLVEEVLSHQPENIKTFLLQTSILDRFCGELCDELLGPSESEASQSILEYMEKENLFLISLDGERRWFRYHHLFADLLRTRLNHLCPGDVPKLHLRASAWFEKNQLLEEAVSHALAAQDLQKAGHLINQAAESMIAHSGSFTLMKWIQKLPDQYVRTQPWLCIALGWAYGYRGLLDDQEMYLKEAENHICPEDSLPLQQKWHAHICSLRSLVANTRGNFPETIGLSNEALGLLSKEDVGVRVVIGYNLGRAYISLSDFSRAEAVLWETARLCMEHGIHHILAPNISAISRGYRMQGRLHDAVDKIQSLLTYLEEHNPKSIFAASCAYLGNIEVLREWNQLDQGEELARNTLEALEPWNSHNCTCACATHLARILQAQGKLEETQSMLQFATQVIERNIPFGDIRSDLNSAWIKYWLKVGDLRSAGQWKENWLKSHTLGETFSIVAEQDEITVARVLIAERKYSEGVAIVSRLAKSAEEGRRHGKWIEILALQAVALDEDNNHITALEVLEKCLALGKPEGYVQVFLELGEPMYGLLSSYLKAAVLDHKDYVEKLIQAFAQSDGSLGFHQSDLIDPLTPREIDVLRLLAAGCSNRQIAEKLFLAEGTVKFYVHVILEKLQVRSRTQAILEAKEKKLI